MRTILTSLLMLLHLIGGTQISTKINEQRPEERIRQIKENGRRFRPVEMFRAVASAEPEVTLTLLRPAIADVLSSSPEQLQFSLPQDRDRKTVLELYAVELYSEDFRVRTSTGQTLGSADLPPGRHYHGMVEGEAGSLASISIYEDESSLLVSTPGSGNLVVEKLPTGSGYRLHREKNGTKLDEFYCQSADVGEEYRTGELIDSPGQENIQQITRIYFEVDYDIYLDKGGVEEVVSFVSAIFNEVAALYANENIRIVLSEIFVWDQPSPYQDGSSLGMLSQFQSERKDFNGDLGQLLSYKSSGGIAVVGGLCHPVTAAKVSFASIFPTVERFPNYSWTTLVVAHELGHLFGSMHTHACVWNGNNTAIDGCSSVEGNCPDNAPIPIEGGTIMSYCHLRNTGTNFSLGFGEQPGNLIRNRIRNATCLQTYEEEGTDEEEEDPEVDPNNMQALDFKVVLDHYPMEVSWSVIDAAGKIWYRGGPYTKERARHTIQAQLTLPSGTYKLIVEDYYADGLCCNYGEGYYTLRDSEERLLASGSQFGERRVNQFQIGEDEPSEHPDLCTPIDLADFEIQSYGGIQDNGESLVVPDQNTLILKNNAWKAILFNYDVTSSTILEFDFASTREGDIHGIGLGRNNTPTGSRSFQLFGQQHWGIQDFNNYEGNSIWQTYRIPVGQYYTGPADRLFFINDDDGEASADGYFRNLVLREGAECQASMAAHVTASLPRHGGLTIAPNPGYGQIDFQFQAAQNGMAKLIIYNLMSRAVFEEQLLIDQGFNSSRIDLSGLPGGLYLAELRMPGQTWVKKLELLK